MKKHALLLLAVLCLILFSSPVWAADGSGFELTLKEGEAVYKINGVAVNAEKPFSESGTLLASADAVAKAFELELVKEADGKSLTLKYAGSTLTVQPNSKEAVGDGAKVTLPQAPVVKNGTVMIPLRYVVEFFGGEVRVDDQTKLVTAVKTFAGDNSIRDFSLLLKKTTKERVGDSHYGWSMQLPKELKISYRSFNGTYTTFQSYDETYYLYLFIRDRENDTLDTLLSEAIRYTGGYTLTGQEKVDRDGQEFVRVSYMDDEGFYEDRLYLKGGKVFKLGLEVYDSAKYKEDKGLTGLLDSFGPEFVADGKTEDLSDVTPDGYRIYEDKSLKLSVKVPANWQDYVSQSKKNDITFTETSPANAGPADRLNIRMFSRENGLTPDRWLQDDLQLIKDEYNPELVKVLSTEDVTINGVKGKKLVSTIQYADRTDYGYTLYLVGEKYRYEIDYVSGKLNDNPIKKSMIDSITGSFKFSEPDAGEVGTMIDPDKLPKLSSFRKVENKDRKYSFQVPVDWVAASTTPDLYSYVDKDGTISLSFVSVKNLSFDTYVDYYENTLLKSMKVSGHFTAKSKETFKDKGTTVKKYVSQLLQDGRAYEKQYFVLEKNGYLYVIALDMLELKASEKNRALLDTIWSSIKFE